MTSLAISLVDELYNKATSTLTHQSWGPLVAISRSSVTALLKRLQVGQLDIHTKSGVWKFGDPTLTKSKEHNHRNLYNGSAANEPSSDANAASAAAAGKNANPAAVAVAALLAESKRNGTDPAAAAVAAAQAASTIPVGTSTGGVNSGAPHAVLIVKDDAFWVRMFVGADLGFAEAFMLGEVDTPDLGTCFELFIRNRSAISELSTGIVSNVTSWIQGQLNKRYANTKSGSLKNIGAHYDISNAMYEAFLSADMTYSSGVFPTLDADVYNDPSVSLNDLLTNAATAVALGGNNKKDTTAFTNGDEARVLEHRIGDDVVGNKSANAASTVGGLLSPPNSGHGSEPDEEESASTLAASTPAESEHNGSPTRLPDGQERKQGRTKQYTGPSIVVRTRDGSPKKIQLLAKDELEDSQLRKLRLHIERANIRPGDRVLEIGTGWGSFSMEAVKRTGCTVDTLTLSVEQKALAEQRIAAAGLSHAITVHLMDYRDMPASWTDRFDRVVSIEMLEAVGIEFLSTYFRCLDRVLKKEGGAISIQCITMPESRFDSYIRQTDFIRRWIFPGGVLPSVTAIMDAVLEGSQGRLVLDTCHSIGPHYSRTLREWRRRFEAHFDDVIKPALLLDHDDIRKLSPAEQAKEVEVFRRKWIYYFVYCEIGFTQRVIGNHILSFSREGNTTLPVCCA